MNDVPAPVTHDSRGILHPAVLQQHVELRRFPVPPPLDGLVDRFWAVRWDLPDGVQHTQELVTHPCANLSVGSTDGARLVGVVRRLGRRTLAGRGWNVAAMTTPGGLGGFVRTAATTFTDREVPLAPALDVPADLADRIAATADLTARIDVLCSALVAAVVPERTSGAREVARIAALAEHDRQLRSVGDLAAAARVGVRTMQRSFAEYAGVSPLWVLRRYRLMNAAEAVRDGRPVHWATVAADLGYSDQAHLVRDFRATTGTTPDAYARAQR